MAVLKALFQPCHQITSIWHKARSSQLAQDAWKLLLLRFLGLAVAFFASTYAMRSLGPDQLGIGALVLSIVAQGTVLGDLGLNIAGVRNFKNYPDRQDEIVSQVWGIRLRVALVFAVLMLVGGQIGYSVQNARLWWLAAPLLVVSILNPQWIFQGLERVPLFNAIQLVQTLFMAILYFMLFQPGAQAELYLVVALASQVLSWGMAYIFLRRYVKVNWKNFNFRQAWKLVYTNGYAFAIVVTIFVYTSLDIPLITILRSTYDAGVYRAAQNIMGILAPILTMLPLLIYPRLVVWKNYSRKIFIQNLLALEIGLTAIAFLIALSSLIWIPVAFNVLLGPEFIEGIIPCKLLIIAKSIVIIGVVPAWGLHSLDQDKRYFGVTLCAALFSVFFNLFFIPRFGIIAAAYGNIVSETVILVGSSVTLYNFLSTEGGPQEYHEKK